MNTQPEALRLADELNQPATPDWLAKQAAAELRRLHEELQATNRQVEILSDDLAESRKEIAAEREACAKVCETQGVHPALNVFTGGPDWYKHAKSCAAAIRARGNT